MCGATGLALRAVSGETAYRIAKPSYGPMNPPKRQTSSDRMEWGRFDVAGQQVVYAGAPEAAAYAESLATFRLATDISDTKLGSLFDNEGLFASRRSLADEIESEWSDRSHMGVQKLPAGWRHERRMYQLTLPPEGWLVDVGHSDSLAAMNVALRSLLDSHEIDQLTAAHLLGEDRELTTRISEWLWDTVLYDGRRPHGVLFASKHGDDYTCVALYLRALGDGKPLDSEPTESDDGAEIKKPEHNEPLRRVLKLFRLGCF